MGLESVVPLMAVSLDAHLELLTKIVILVGSGAVLRLGGELLIRREVSDPDERPYWRRALNLLTILFVIMMGELAFELLKSLAEFTGEYILLVFAPSVQDPESQIPLIHRALQRVFYSIVVILALQIIRIVLTRVITLRVTDIVTRYHWRRGLNYVVNIVIIISLALIWFPGFQRLGTFLGLLSAGLVIALQDTVANLMGWVFIIWRKPYEVGDRIEIAGNRGDIIDIRLFQTHIIELSPTGSEQSTGRILLVPNGTVLKQPLMNYTKDFRFIWIEIPVLVTFESDWRRAKQILAEIAVEHASSYSREARAEFNRAAQRSMIRWDHLDPCVVTLVKDCGVELIVRCLVPPRLRPQLVEKIWESILEAFSHHTDIDFAYPTQRFYDNRTEGKPDAGGTHSPLAEAIRRPRHGADDVALPRDV